jgi:NhaP-type Na+/H+ or K+/H+ antiporter
MGPYVANVFDPRSWSKHEHQITLEVMRVVLATGLFAIGVELPKAYLKEHVRSLLVMVVPTMAFGWLVVGGEHYHTLLMYVLMLPRGVLKGLFPNLNFVSCLAISACLTPTDPIICAAIVGGKFAIKHVPVELRRILSAESAANDGLAYPFLTLALYLTIDRTSGVAIGNWFLLGWLCTIYQFPYCSSADDSNRPSLPWYYHRSSHWHCLRSPHEIHSQKGVY